MVWLISFGLYGLVYVIWIYAIWYKWSVIYYMTYKYVISCARVGFNSYVKYFAKSPQSIVMSSILCCVRIP